MRGFLALLAVMALAGCMGHTPDRHFTVPEDAGSFQDAHRGDGYGLRILVADANGTPVPGAAVVWFTGGNGAAGFHASGEVTADGESGDVGFTFDSDDGMVAGARTDAQGYATADLPPHRAVHVAAGDAPGLTTEVRFRVTVGGGGESGTVTLVLYPERVPIAQALRMGNHVGATPYLNRPGMDSFPLELAADEGLAQELRARLHRLDLAATWENKVGEGADLHLGLGTDAASPRWTGPDQQQFVADGRHTEVLALEAELVEGRADLPRGAHVFLLTDWISGGMDGVPVQLEGEALLRGSNIVID